MSEISENPQPTYDKKQIAEAFRVDPEKTARPEVRTVGQHSAIGEYHIRLQDDDQGDQTMTSILETADVVIVEFDSQSSGYEHATEHKRFMSMAQDAGQDKQLIIMDAVRPSGIETWKKAGINIEPDDYKALVALDCAQHPVMGMIANPNKTEIDQDQITNDIADRIIKKVPDIDETLAHRLAEGAKRTIMLSSSLGGEIFKLIDKYLRVDSFAREVNYQQIIADEVKKADQKRVVAVVGMSHLKAAEEALSGQFGSRKVKDEVLGQFDKAYDMVTMFVS